MFKYGPPGSTNWGFDEVNTAIQQGLVAMRCRAVVLLQRLQRRPEGLEVRGQDGLCRAAGRPAAPRLEVPPPVLGRRPGHGSQQVLQEAARNDQVHGVVLPARAAEALCRRLPDRPQVRSGKPGLAGSELLTTVSSRRRCSISTTTAPAGISGAARRAPAGDLGGASGTKTVQQALSDAAEKNERTLERAGYEIKRGEKTPEVPDQEISPSGMDQVVPSTDDLLPADARLLPCARPTRLHPIWPLSADVRFRRDAMTSSRTSAIDLAGRWLVLGYSWSTRSTMWARSSGSSCHPSRAAWTSSPCRRSSSSRPTSSGYQSVFGRRAARNATAPRPSASSTRWSTAYSSPSRQRRSPSFSARFRLCLLALQLHRQGRLHVLRPVARMLPPVAVLVFYHLMFARLASPTRARASSSSPSSPMSASPPGS